MILQLGNGCCYLSNARYVKLRSPLTHLKGYIVQNGVFSDYGQNGNDSRLSGIAVMM
jgi:hypothetical protein